MNSAGNRGFLFDLREVNGALGDLGTLLPLTLACIALAGLSAPQVLMGFGVFYIGTGLIYRLPIPVQPMKAIAAVILVTQVSPTSIALSGILIGLVLILLGAGGLIDKIARLVPQSILSGLQLGLGLALGWIAIGLMQDAVPLGLVSLGLAVFCLRYGLHAAIVTLLVGALIGHLTGASGLVDGTAPPSPFWWPQLPLQTDIRTAIVDLALPQMVLTLTNAIILTSLVARDCFGDRAAQVSPRKLCLTSGLANLVLAPLGALPMCHGAGGVAAHHRFGARTGAAPVLLGTALLILATLPSEIRGAALTAIPSATLGALLLIAAGQLATSRRLFDCKPSCRPVIAITALATLVANPLVALIAGTAAELLRKAILKRVLPPRAQI